MQYGHVLVTGGAGFLGSQLVLRLLQISERIIVLDDLSTGKRAAVPDAETIDFIEGSVLDEALLERILPDVDIVFHLACSNLVQSEQDMDRDYRTNLFGGYLLMKKALECCRKSPRFIYTSTASIYGNAQQIPTPENEYQISLPYSASKLGAELYGHVFCQMMGLRFTTVRLSNVYGPGQLPSNPYCGVVSKFFHAVRKQVPLIIYGDGLQTRDFTFVDDAIDAILCVANSEATVNKVYNIGTGIETSVLELAKQIGKAAGYPSYPYEFNAPRPVDKVMRRAVDISRIKHDLGWQPARTLQEGLEKTFRWFQLEEGSL